MNGIHSAAALTFQAKKSPLCQTVKQRKIKKLFLVLGSYQDRGCCQETLRTFGIDFPWKVWGVFSERWW